MHTSSWSSDHICQICQCRYHTHAHKSGRCSMAAHSAEPWSGHESNLAALMNIAWSLSMMSQVLLNHLQVYKILSGPMQTITASYVNTGSQLYRLMARYWTRHTQRIKGDRLVPWWAWALHLYCAVDWPGPRGAPAGSGCYQGHARFAQGTSLLPPEAVPARDAALPPARTPFSTLPHSATWWPHSTLSITRHVLASRLGSLRLAACTSRSRSTDTSYTAKTAATQCCRYMGHE